VLARHFVRQFFSLDAIATGGFHVVVLDGSFRAIRARSAAPHCTLLLV